jgi:FKBP12-rapamycin complex-associated protein
MYLLLPTLVRLFKPDISNAPLEIKQATINMFGRILPSMEVGSYFSTFFSGVFV